MITNYNSIHKAVSRGSPVSLAIVNPKQDYLLLALKESERKGWIKPNIFSDPDPVKATHKALTAMNTDKPWLLMKGDIDTASLLKAVMNSQLRKDKNRLLTHIAVLESPRYKRLLLTTDGGVNTEISEDILTAILENVLLATKALQISKPNIAMLALVEKVTSKLPETIFAQEAVQRYKDDQRFIIEGPVALDVALSATAARAKGLSFRIAGQTDVFIGPNITAINFVSKALLSIGGAQGGGIILGASVPIVLLSRSDTLETKLNSIALGLLILQGENNGY
jgi:phosphate butyryltransferase